MREKTQRNDTGLMCKKKKNTRARPVKYIFYYKILYYFSQINNII